MSKILYGFELEFAFPIQCSRILPSALQDHFLIGTDASVTKQPKMFGCELRTLNPTPGLNEQKWSEALQYIRTKGGQITNTSGFHIHFSLWDGADIAFRPAWNKFRAIKAWNSRYQWMHDLSGRYSALRLVERTETCEHYEVRVFNGSLNWHAIRNYFRITERIIRECIVN